MDLRDYLSVLRRRKWIIVITVIVVAATVSVLTFFETPVYRASARLLFQPSDAIFSSRVGVSDAIVSTEIEVMHSTPVSDLVRQKLGRAPSVSASPVSGTTVVELSAESTVPKDAAAITNAYVDAYISYRRKQAVDSVAGFGQELQHQVDDLQKGIDDLKNRLGSIGGCTGLAPPPECLQRDALQADRDQLLARQAPLKQKLDQLQVDSAGSATVGAQVVAPAAVPTVPIRPRPLHNAVLAIGVGLVLGTALAFAFDHLDDTIKTKEDLEHLAAGLSVLGVIPAIAGWKNRQETRVVSLAEPSAPAAEAYRALRTSIQFLGVDRSLRVIQITSPRAAEGKSTTIANFAVTLVRAGLSVVVVDCDLRRSRIHEFFHLPNAAAGFTSLMLGDAPLSAALQNVPGELRLKLLSAGPLPPNPSELLSSRRTSEILESLKRAFDVVLIDCPPVLPVTDAAVLSSKVEGTLVVATAGVTTRKQMSRALEMLRQVEAPLIGMMLNGASGEEGYGYKYGYKYYRLNERTNGQTPDHDSEGASDQRAHPLISLRLLKGFGSSSSVRPSARWPRRGP